MKIKKLAMLFLVLLFSLLSVFVVYADEDDDEEDDSIYDEIVVSEDARNEYGPGNLNGVKPDPTPLETTIAANGPEVVEYYDYTTPRELPPGSLSGEVNFDYIGRGLYYDGTDFYFFLDTGILATNYMYNMEGDRFLFGEDGKMVKDQLIEYSDELYYFDKNGAMYKNRWLTVSEYDPYEKMTEYKTYYFGRTGRAYRAKGSQGVLLKEIEGAKYGFNEDGELLKGFVDADGNELNKDEEYAYMDCLYFFDPDDEYAAYSGWLLYESSLIEDEYENYDEVYLYFDPKTYRKVKSANNERYLNRTIDNERYIFDSNGIKVNNWAGVMTASHSNIRYYNEEYDGYLSKGWFSAIPSDQSTLQRNIDSNIGSSEQWFYASRNGSILRKCIRKIGQFTYAFDDDGVMQSEMLVVVENGEFKRSYDLDDVGYKEVVYSQAEGGLLYDGEKWMYFTGGRENEDLEGSMCKTGTMVLLGLKDRDVKFMCNNQGGYSSKAIGDAVVRNGRFIQNGVVLMPEKDNNKYGIVRESSTEEITIKDFKNWEGTDIGDQSGLKYWIVNKQGRKVSGSYTCYKDSLGNYIYLGPNGIYLGYFSVQGKYVNGKWKYRDPEDKKVWHDTFPLQQYAIDDDDLYLNFETLDNSLSDLMY